MPASASSAPRRPLPARLALPAEIEIDGLTKRFGGDAPLVLDHIDLSIRHNEFVALLVAAVAASRHC